MKNRRFQATLLAFTGLLLNGCGYSIKSSHPVSMKMQNPDDTCIVSVNDHMYNCVADQSLGLREIAMLSSETNTVTLHLSEVVAGGRVEVKFLQGGSPKAFVLDDSANTYTSDGKVWRTYPSRSGNLTITVVLDHNTEAVVVATAFNS